MLALEGISCSAVSVTAAALGDRTTALLSIVLLAAIGVAIAGADATSEARETETEIERDVRLIRLEWETGH